MRRGTGRTIGAAGPRGIETCRDGDVAPWLDIVRAEYLEIPGLHLTKAQMQRLWSFDQQICDRVLNALIGANFLKRADRDGYVLVRSPR